MLHTAQLHTALHTAQGVTELASVVTAYPDTFQRDAYHTGVQLGYSFISDAHPLDRHEYLTGLRNEWGQEDAVHFDEDTAASMASDIFQTYSEYSPWECTASFWNDRQDADEVWAAFEAGLSWGARYAWWKVITGISA